MADTWSSQFVNHSVFDVLQKELVPAQSNMYLLLISICCAIIWVVYLTYYNSRVLGLILTAVLNRFIPYGHVKFGSFSVSVLSGKIMFRDVHFISEDFTVRIQLGLAIFRWWRPLTEKELTEDLSHSETRLSLYLDNFELHVYNRSAIYSRLEQLFGLDQFIIPPSDSNTRDDVGSDTGGGGGRDGGDGGSGGGMKTKSRQWRDLIPVIKVEVISGRLVFGNYLLPQTLSVHFGDTHLMYTTKPASTPFDQFMHIVKCTSDNVRVMLVPSPEFTGIRDEPPRSMGDGFAVMQSNNVDIYYYMDEPGLVPYEPEMVQLADGDVITVRTWPCWGMDIKCGKSTDISYGPWADRQREHLWKFFYPVDYRPNDTTVLPVPGEMRTWKSFDFKMSMQNDVNIDILFTKNKETQAIHMSAHQGSYMEFTIPFVIESSGYVTKINGQLMHVDTTTSLKFRSLLNCETLEFVVEIKYPKYWNDHQDWKIDLIACRTSGALIFHHKSFFADLVEDWASKSRPDILKFIPYTVNVCTLLKEFEIATLTNEWNWIDCFGLQNQENAHLGVGGETFDLSFSLPFTDYLPATVPLKIFIRGESAKAQMYLPEQNTSRHSVVALANNMKLINRDGTTRPPQGIDGAAAIATDRKWRKVFQPSAGWVEVWSTPIAAVSITYTYHPMPPLKGSPDYYLPDEFSLRFPAPLIPQRPLRPRVFRRGVGGEGGGGGSQDDEFNPMTLDPDQISVEIEIGPSVCYAYGSLVRNFLHLKENYFGEDQKFSDFEKCMTDEKASTFEHFSWMNEGAKDKEFDERNYRPLHVRVALTLHDVQAHLVRNCLEDGAPCPCVFLERLGFELDKKYEETLLQVILSPALLIVKDMIERPESHSNLSDGHLALSALQIRGHAMFSHKGLPLDSETLEYAWLLEITVGDLTGRLTAPQLQNIAEFLQTFLYLVTDPENVLQPAVDYKLCQHMVLQSTCTANMMGGIGRSVADVVTPCQTSDDIKYRVTRVSVDCIDIYLVETGSALNVQVYPVRLSTCNLHSMTTKLGITALIKHVNIKQFVLSISSSQAYDSNTDVWLEAGGISLGPINVDTAATLPSTAYLISQQRFLRLHDHRTRRLTFLWGTPSNETLPANSNANTKVGKQSPHRCGCVGGCIFFGDNRNGANFFTPSDRDFVESTNAAVQMICMGVEGGQGTVPSYGFGQSLLHPRQLVLNLVAVPLSHAKTKAMLTRQRRFNPHPITQEDTMDETLLAANNTTISRDLTLVANTSSIEWPSTVGALRESGEVRVSGLPLRVHDIDRSMRTTGSKLTAVDEQEGEWVGSGEEDGAEARGTLRESGYRDGKLPMDLARIGSGGRMESANSLTDLTAASAERQSDIAQRPLAIHHERTRSYDPPKTFRSPDKACASGGGTPSTSGGSSSGVTGFYKGESHNSLCSHGSGGLSRHSSLTSPVLRRLSSLQSVGTTTGDGSSASVASMGSEMADRYESAASSVGGLSQTVGSGGASVRFGGMEGAEMDGEETLVRGTILRSPDSDMASSLSSRYSNAVEYIPDLESSTDADSYVSAVSSPYSDQQIRSPYSRLRDRDDDERAVCSDDDDDDAGTFAAEEEIDEDEDGEFEGSGVETDATQVPATSAANFVNLHGQINQPIAKSPLLMSCYMNHMTQLHCSDWASAIPHSSCIRTERSRAATSSSYVSRMQPSTWIPQFAYINEGFVPSLMTPRARAPSPPIISGPATAATSAASNSKGRKSSRFLFDAMEPSMKSSDSETDGKTNNHVSKMTAVVNLKGHVDIMISPLMLEALQRYLEAVTPVLASLHPSTIVDSLHFKCIDAVETQNKPKHSDSSCLSGLAAKDGLVDRTGERRPADDEKSSRRKQQSVFTRPKEDMPTSVGVLSSQPEATDEQESKKSRLQLILSLTKINICILQASLVEEIVSIAALERARELTCVSVLAASIDSIDLQLLANSVSLRKRCPNKLAPVPGENSATLIPPTAKHRPSTTSVSKKHMSSTGDVGTGVGPGTGNVADLNQVVETRREDTVGSLTISRVHFQLRRIKKHSNYSESVFLTAIPEHRSNVCFTFTKQPSNGFDGLNGTGTTSRPEQVASPSVSQQHDYFDEHASTVEDLAGFIMFECGLETIRVHAARRNGYANITATTTDVGGAPAVGVNSSGNNSTDLKSQSVTSPDVASSSGGVMSSIGITSPVSPPGASISPGVSSLTADVVGVGVIHAPDVTITVSSPDAILGPTQGKGKAVLLHQPGERVRQGNETAVLILQPTRSSPVVKLWEGDADAASIESDMSSFAGNTADNEASSAGSRESLTSSNAILQGTTGEGSRGEGALGTAEVAMSPEDELQGDASSVLVTFQMAWFNFAAPPPSPKKRKLEYTRYDWNLLSTATPAINAWMNPCHRAILSANHLYDQLNRRICTVMACLMTDALDVQGIHMPVKSKYGRIKSLSRSLQEDPSCQLLTVLRRYIHKVGVLAIEESLSADTIPQLLTVKKGLLVLTRQWKNVLYVPISADTNFKLSGSQSSRRAGQSIRKCGLEASASVSVDNKKNNVTFALPVDVSSDNVNSADSLSLGHGKHGGKNSGGADRARASGFEEGEHGLENCDIVDEKTSLLQAEGGGSLFRVGGRGLRASAGGSSGVFRRSRGSENGYHNEGSIAGDDDATLSMHTAPSQGQIDSGRQQSLDSHSGEQPTPFASDPYFSISGVAGATSTPHTFLPSAHASSHAALELHASNQTFGGAGSASTRDSLSGDPITPAPSMPSTPIIRQQNLTRQLPGLADPPLPGGGLGKGERGVDDADMHQWMARQQEYMRQTGKVGGVGGHHFGGMGGVGGPSLHYYPSVGHDSWTFTGVSDQSQDDDSLNVQRVNTVTHPAFQLADAQVLFKPLLRSMGLQLDTIKMSAVMKKFGGDVSVRSTLAKLRIEIIDTETVGARGGRNPAPPRKLLIPGKVKDIRSAHFCIDAGHIDLPAFFCDTFDVRLSMKDVVDFEVDRHAEGHDVNEDDTAGLSDARRKSWHTLKIALNHIEARPTTTKVNFAVNCRSMNQHVNMSLLRLVHQFVTMIENILKTKTELRSAGEDVQASPYDSGGSPAILTPSEGGLSETEGGGDITPQHHAGRPTVVTGHTPQLPRPQRTPTAAPDSGKHTQQHQPPHQRKRATPRPDALPDLLPGMSGRTSHTRQAKATTAVSEGTSVQSPLHSLNPSDSVAIDMTDTSSPGGTGGPAARRTIADEIKENTPRCWRTLYHLLDLYSILPEMKTYRAPSQLSVIPEDGESQSRLHSMSTGAGAGAGGGNQVQSGQRRPDRLVGAGARARGIDKEGGERQPMLDQQGSRGPPLRGRVSGTFTQNVVIADQIPVVVFGVAKVDKILITAMLSGLKLEADLHCCQGSATYRERIKGSAKKRSHESSATVSIGQTTIALLEGIPPNMQTVVNFKIARSQGLHSAFLRRSTPHNSGLLTIGLVEVDIPQHPVALHSMVSRSSKRLSTTLQEFIRFPSRSKASFDLVDMGLQQQRQQQLRLQQLAQQSHLITARHAQPNAEQPTAAPSTSTAAPQQQQTRDGEAAAAPHATHKTGVAVQQSKPFIIHFKATVDGLAVGASLLPSLRAQYKIGKVMSSGVTGNKARFTVDLPIHSLSFASKLFDESIVNPKLYALKRSIITNRLAHIPWTSQEETHVNTSGNLPSSAEIALPPVRIHADYRQHDPAASAEYRKQDPSSPGGGHADHHGLAEGLTLREGSYLKATADVGVFEHILTTDLLNHLVFVQKVFMKEVNEVVQKVSGVDQPVPLWSEDFTSAQERVTKPLLYLFIFRLNGIQITATTPTSNAVRLQTEKIELELSNRVQRAEAPSRRSETIAGPLPTPAVPKVFVKAKIDLNLALGTLIKSLYDESEPDLQELANFKTTITLRNALQDEMIPGASKDQEALLIVVQRPIIFILPAAFDKAVLVWLNYKNAYEYWTEQRLALNKEMQNAGMFTKLSSPLPLFTPASASSSTGAPGPFSSTFTGGATRPPAILSTLFLQLTVGDLGMCLPMNPFTQSLGGVSKIDEPGAALVLTLESTQISACSCGSLVSKGKFTGFCLRFADDFDVSWDDWKPNKTAGMVMNALVVPEGTYEVCSRTINANGPHTNAKWILNVLWQMRGIDIHLDTNIGKRLSAIGSTVTTFAGEDGFSDEVSQAEGGQNYGCDQAGVPIVKLETPSRKQSVINEALLPDFIYDERIDPKTRSRLVENEMNEQAKVVQNLRKLGANKTTIEGEERKLNELKYAAIHDFRQDLFNKLKRKNVKASVLKDKLGLGGPPGGGAGLKPLVGHSRSQSVNMSAALRRSKDLSSRTHWSSSYYGGESLAEDYNSGSVIRRHRPNHQRTVSLDVAAARPVTLRGQQTLRSFAEEEFESDDSTPGTPSVKAGTDDASFPSYNTLVVSSEDEDGEVERESREAEEMIVPPRQHNSPQSLTVDYRNPPPSEAGPYDDTTSATTNVGFTPPPPPPLPPPLQGPSSSTAKPQVEPSIDFELDVKVGIDSGKCVLHPKEHKSDLDLEEGRRASKGHNASPRADRKKGGVKKTMSESMATSSSRLGQQSSVTDNRTVFFLPGVDVKVHYSSKTGPAVIHDIPAVFLSESSSPPPSAATTGGPGRGKSSTTGSTDVRGTHPAGVGGVSGGMTDGHNMGGSLSGEAGKKSVLKKANLYAWLSLQQLSEEMLISPSLLDFLEQVIEPIPLMLGGQKTQKNNCNGEKGMDDLGVSAVSLVSSSNYAYGTFPVDIVVYLHVQPSLIRFTCLPVSRVECLLRLPSVDVVFSTKKSDIETNILGDASPPVNVKATRRSTGSLPQRPGSGGAARTRVTSGAQVETLMGGGLSITVCLNDFSLYIFHPYGGGQKKTSLSALENTFRKGIGKNATGSDDKTSSMLDGGRKDSFSLNVEFVKVNISRSRKGVVSGDILSSSISSPKFSDTTLGMPAAANIVRFSAVCDIGTASFKYDMRRLLEILALPKAWYRRSLARRMFLGEEPTVEPDSESEVEETFGNISSSPPMSSESSIHTTGDQSMNATSRYSKNEDLFVDAQQDLTARPLNSSTSGIRHDSISGGRTARSSPRPTTTGSTYTDIPNPFFAALRAQPTSATTLPTAAPAATATSVAAAAVTAGSKGATGSNWETLVLFAVSLSQLNVMVNMSNVMGNVLWSTRVLKSQGRLSVDSGGYKNMKLMAGLGSSKLEAKGGIIGGSIELQELNTQVCISEDMGREPEHVMKLNLEIIESRVDYMGSSILMFRFSDLDVTMQDKWQVEAFHRDSDSRPMSMANSRSLSTFVDGELSWDKLHLMISRSTTPDLIKIIHKLEEFLTQQLTSSKRALSAFGQMSTAYRSKAKQKDDADLWMNEYRHHRHWQCVLEHLCGGKLPMFSAALPDSGTVIGGAITLQGKNISLACFHGINFRSKSWALFTMNDPYISFATEAANVKDENGSPCTHVLQDLTFKLGNNITEVGENRPMAMVCKLSRGHYMPPPFTSVTEWFHYSFSTGEIKQLYSFPVMTRQGADPPLNRQASRAPADHETEIIFILPSLEMRLKTEHLQAENEPSDGDPKPVVECSFITEFDDHIFVAMDAEAVFFLHDLVINYVKEKDRGASKAATSQKSSEASEREMLENPTMVLKQDYRDFDCKTWRLEPTVRLLSWAGKRIDPVAVDYILQRLGFQHARLTIPKWMQRGCMDPLDKILSLLVDKLLTSLEEDKHDADN